MWQGSRNTSWKGTITLVELFLWGFFFVLLQKVINGFLQQLVEAPVRLSSENFERPQKIGIYPKRSRKKLKCKLREDEHRL